MPEIENFPIHIPETDLADLAARLERTRLPRPESDASQGLALGQLTALLDTWRQHEWAALEKRWNSIPHHRLRLDGLDLAFWHLRSPEPDAVPLILTHGWPGSVLEFEGLLGALTDPVAHGGSAKDAFHVVVPSLPGYGFSERTDQTPWGPARTARAWADLMTALGYERFAAHGGDWGAHVSTDLGHLFPERVIGLHLTMPIASPLPEDEDTTDEAEQRMIQRRALFMQAGDATHVLLQGLRPQTMAYSLLDSPAGLAAWLGEKLHDFAGEGPDGAGAVPLERQVDNIALYWFTRTGDTSARWYWDSIRSTPTAAQDQNAQAVTVPTACSLFPGEPFPIARRWAERRYQNLLFWHEMPVGGHFAGWEQPDALIREIRAAFAHARP